MTAADAGLPQRELRSFFSTGLGGFGMREAGPRLKAGVTVGALVGSCRGLKLDPGAGPG